MGRATLLLLYSLSGSVCFAQLNGNLYHLDVTDGLSNGTVHTTCQDQEGLMWFGTSNGLNSYDGYDFKAYQYDKHDSNSISNNVVVKILEKSNQELWIGTHYGLNIFRKKTGQFELIKADPTDPKALSNHSITDLVRQGDDYLWVATSWGLNKVNAKAPYQVVDRYLQGEDERSWINGRVNCLLLNGSDLWIGTDNGISILNVNTGQFQNLSDSPLKSSLTNKIIRGITKDTFETFWIATENGANHYFPDQDSVVRYFPNSGDPTALGVRIVQQIYEDSQHNLWFGTDGAGLYQYDREQDAFIANQKNLYKPLSLSTDAIYSIYESSDNILWIGTYEKGIHYFDKRKSAFRTFTHDPFHNSVSQSSVKAVIKSKFKNGLWIGTSSEGVNFIDLETEQFTFYKHEANNPNTLRSNIIKALHEDHSGKLWVGTFTGGLNCFDAENRTNIQYPVMPPDNAATSSSHIWHIYEDKRGNFWIGTLRGGLILFDPETEDYEHYAHDPHDSTSIASNLISVMYEDSKGNFWVGSEEESGGLNLMDRDSRTFKRYTHNPDDPSSISHNFIREIFEDSKHNLWIGTRQGLNLFHSDTETFTNLNHLGAPFNGTINDVLEDDDHYLWISTNEGIFRFDSETYEYIHFDVKDGLQGNEFNYNSALKLEDGRLFFGGLNGFNLFDPKDIVTDENFPRVILTDFKLKDESIEPGNSTKLSHIINYTESVTLDSDESTLSISFAGINYYAPQKIKYAYRLDGLEKKWRFVGNERKASYTNLDPGDYTFHVKASNSFGDWGNNAASIKLRILPAWYETGLFKIMSGLLFLGGVLGFLQYRTKNLSRKKLMLQQMVRQRTAEIEELNTELANSNKSLQYINHTLVRQRNELTKTVGELKVTRDRLVISEKMASIGVFTAGIAHELNNPINYVSGATKLLCEIVDKHVKSGKTSLEGEELETIMELKKTILLGVEKTTDIVKSLRNYVHEDTEEFKSFNLVYCIEDALKLLISEYKDHITIQKELPKELFIDCLPGRINQIIVNLLSNAIDAIKGQGRIFISVSQTSQYAILKVRDTGEGIPQRMLAKLYDPFFTTKEVGKGMGLGLYIVYGLVDVHNGKISVNSVEGRGTEFTVELPIKQKTVSDNRNISIQSPFARKV